MERLTKMSAIEEWPLRADPQERFDTKVAMAMNQMGTLVEELNTNLIPRANEVIDAFDTILVSLGATYMTVRPTKVPEDVVDGGLIIYRDADSLGDYEVIQVHDTDLISLGFLSHALVHTNKDENIVGKYTFTVSPEVPTVSVSDSSGKVASTKFVQEVFASINTTLDAINNEVANAVLSTGNQGIAGVKSFTESPILPTPFADDSSQKGATTAYVTNAIQNITNKFTEVPDNPLFEDDSTKIATTHFVKDMFRAEIEAVSGGCNTVIRDRFGYPHIMVVIPRFNMQDIDSSLGTGTHPAFIVNDVVKSEIFIGKYLASKGNDNRVKTTPRKEPWVNITFDEAITTARDLGAGFSVCTRASYSARVLWLWKQFEGRLYTGNTNWGKSYHKPWQTGTMLTTAFSPGDITNNITGVTLTGSGPIDWNDDGTPFGITDLTGNIWEWESGARIKEGEIQLITNNDAILSTTDLSASSSAWRAVSPTGVLLVPGSVDTLKYTSPTSGTANMGVPSVATTIVQVTGAGHNSCEFKTLTALGSTDIPSILKQYTFFPVANTNMQGLFDVKNYDERLPLRGGCIENISNSGPYCVNLTQLRSLTSRTVGFRICFSN